MFIILEISLCKTHIVGKLENITQIFSSLSLGVFCSLDMFRKIKRDKKILIGYEIRYLVKVLAIKPSTFRATLFRCKFGVGASRFSPCVINLSATKMYVAG